MLPMVEPLIAVDPLLLPWAEESLLLLRLSLLLLLLLALLLAALPPPDPGLDTPPSRPF